MNIKVIDSPGIGGEGVPVDLTPIADAIGPPATPEDTLTQLAGHVTDGKTAVAGSIGGGASGSETFAQLTARVNSANDTVKAFLTGRDVPNVTQTQLAPLVARLGDVPEGKKVTAGNSMRIDIARYAATPPLGATGTSTPTLISGQKFTADVEGTVRIGFQLMSAGSAYPSNAQIFRNGAPIGTQRTATSSTYQNYTEDFNMSIGDVFELRAWSTTAGAFRAGNLYANFDSGILITI